MVNHSPERRFPFNLDLVLHRSLGRTLLLCFLGCALLPTAIVGAISYQTARNHAEQEAQKNIRIVTAFKSRQLQTYLDDHRVDADSKDRERTTASLFDSVDQILSRTKELGAGSRVYLVDSDLTLLAGTIGVPDRRGGSTPDTAQTRLWRDNLTGGLAESPLPVPFTYSGPDGTPVIGAHAPIHLGDIPYALIVEIETRAVFRAVHRLRAMILTIGILAGLGVLVVSTALARMIVVPVRHLSQNMAMVADGRLEQDVHRTAGNEIGELTTAFEGMLDHLNAVKMENDAQSRFMSGLFSLHRSVSGEQELGDLCFHTLERLYDFLDLGQADFFIVTGDGAMECISRFPGHPDQETQRIFDPLEGRVGQAALKKATAFFLKDANSGSATPVSTADRANLIAVPLVLQQRVIGVLELEKAGLFGQFDIRFVEAAAHVMAIAVNAALKRQQEETLLNQTREQADKLKVREAALEASTRELQTQSLALQASEEKLQLKQMELEAASAQMVKNAADLEAHMAILQKQKLAIQQQNTELEKTHLELAEKARQLEISSRYKTEFMANMSHELRTPLNSILLLSRLLLENKDKTLNAKQSEFAQTIHSAGEDLLHLINEILDLAKVESGKMEVELRAVQVQSIAKAMRVSFSPLAEQRGVAFTIHVAPDVPERLFTDRKRIEQIVKNFLSNAFKFTAAGSIRLEIAVTREPARCHDAGDNHDTGCLAISVVDTGIGIPANKHQMVFDAFQQVDGSTRRKYGGTGLGLSISRELARLLGGEITLESRTGRGSRFTLHLPIIPIPDKEPAMIRSDPLSALALQADEPETSQGLEPVPDDRHRNRLQAMDKRRPVLKDRNVLLVDDDMRTVFAVSNILEDQGANVLTGKTGKESLDKLNCFPEIDLVLMDVMIAEVDGYQAIRKIRNRDRYRDLPIIVLTAKAMQGDRAKCIEAGADDYLAKPVNPDKLTSMLKIWLDPQRASPEQVGG